jgi:HK97 family phage major capsid protein
MNLKEQLMVALKAARDICDKVDQEKRDFNAEERQKVTGYLTEAGELKKQIKAKEGDEDLKKQILDLGAGISLNDAPHAKQDPVRPGKGKTIGERFVESAEYQAWYKHVAPSGQIPDGVKGLVSPPVEFKDLITGLDDTSAGAFVNPDYTGIYEPLGRRPLTVMDLVNRLTTTSDMVEFVRQTKKITEAAAVPEANIKVYTGATGEIEGKKPQGAIYFEKVFEVVKTIAVWVAATKRALSDAAQIRGIIDNELRDDLAEKLEDNVLVGDGVGENFLGIANYPGVMGQGFLGTTALATCRRAVTNIQVFGFSRPTAWVFNPTDWEAIETAQDLVNQYYGGGPFGSAPKMLWGYPVAECAGWPAGRAILADWRKVKVWDRQRATISVTDSHEDFFVRNIIAILAELRAAFGIIRPQAVWLVDLL